MQDLSVLLLRFPYYYCHYDSLVVTILFGNWLCLNLVCLTTNFLFLHDFNKFLYQVIFYFSIVFITSVHVDSYLVYKYFTDNQLVLEAALSLLSAHLEFLFGGCLLYDFLNVMLIIMFLVQLCVSYFKG